MLDGMSDSIQGSRIENLQSREVDRQSHTGLIFIIIIIIIIMSSPSLKIITPYIILYFVIKLKIIRLYFIDTDRPIRRYRTR